MPALAMFLVAIAVSLILERQEKIHWLQLELEYRRAGLELPKRVPSVSKFEAWANIVLGVMLLVAGTYFFLLLKRIPEVADIKSVLQLASLVLAGGAALVILGLKALKLSQAM